MKIKHLQESSKKYNIRSSKLKQTKIQTLIFA